MRNQGCVDDLKSIADGRFGDELQINVVAYKFLNLPTVSTLLNCSWKIPTVGIHGQGAAKKTCQTSKEIAYLAFDCLSELWHPAPPNVCTCSPRGNLWHPLSLALREATVGKGLEVRIYSYTDRKKERIYS